MNVERLNKLADYLDTVPAKQFDMGDWYTEDEVCGTSACVLGHACMIPEFNAAGLQLTMDNFWVEWVPTYKEHHYERAAEIFFDLESHEADSLVFGSHKTPSEAAEYIRDLITEHQT